jgi:hypothetical protein
VRFADWISKGAVFAAVESLDENDIAVKCRGSNAFGTLGLKSTRLSGTEVSLLYRALPLSVQVVNESPLVLQEFTVVGAPSSVGLKRLP